MTLLGVSNLLMVRIVRSRSRVMTLRGTRKSWVDATSNGPPDTNSEVTLTYTSLCSDRVGSPVVDSSFTSTQRKGALVLTGTAITKGNRKYTYQDYPVFSQINAGVPLSPPSGWVLDLIAGTNPSRPVVTPPELVQNLIELPKLLYNTMAFLSNPRKAVNTPKGIADNYLAFKFGWLPLIEDLTKLLELQKYVIKRNKELSQLYSGKGLRRRLRFANETTVTTSSYIAAFETPRSIEWPVSVKFEKESWGTARWHPTSPPPFHPLDPEWNNYTRRLVLGLTPEGMATGLWKVIPWTWLLGWFTNVGKYTLLHSNTVPAQPSHLNFMSKIVATRTCGAPKQNQIAYSNLEFWGSMSTEYRSRVPASGPATPGLSMPYLDIGRLSVLAALFVQRMKR